MAMTLQQSVALSASGRQQHHRMSIAFLAGQTNEDIEMTNSYYAPEFAPAAVPVAELEVEIPCYQLDSRTPINLPLLRLDDSPYSNRPCSVFQLPRPGSFSSINSFESVQSVNSWDDSNESCPSNAISSFSNIITSPVKRHDSILDFESTASATSSATSYHSSNILSSVNKPHAHDQDYQRTHLLTMAKPFARIARPARPPYSDEQKFFIMYYRVIKELSWPKLEDKFANFFNLRTRDGLTSVYYRIRKNWGMEDVLKTSRDGSRDDRGKVESKAAHLSCEFLTNLGYFD